MWLPTSFLTPSFHSILMYYIQMNAGAVMLTDCIYWLIIYPFLTIKDYNLSFVSTTTLNTSSTSLCSIIFLALGKNRCVPESCSVRNSHFFCQTLSYYAKGTKGMVLNRTNIVYWLGRFLGYVFFSYVAYGLYFLLMFLFVSDNGDHAHSQCCFTPWGCTVELLGNLLQAFFFLTLKRVRFI